MIMTTMIILILVTILDLLLAYYFIVVKNGNGANNPEARIPANGNELDNLTQETEDQPIIEEEIKSEASNESEYESISQNENGTNNHESPIPAIGNELDNLTQESEEQPIIDEEIESETSNESESEPIGINQEIVPAPAPEPPTSPYCLKVLPFCKHLCDNLSGHEGSCSCFCFVLLPRELACGHTHYFYCGRGDAFLGFGGFQECNEKCGKEIREDHGYGRFTSRFCQTMCHYPDKCKTEIFEKIV